MNDARQDELDALLRAQFESAMKRFESATGKTTIPVQSKGAAQNKSSEDSLASHLRRGKIAGVTDREVFVDLGEREQGVLSIEEFATPPAIGDSYEFTLIDLEDDLWVLSLKDSRRLATWKTLLQGNWVQATVTAINPGGLSLKIGPLEAFMPVSQIDLKPTTDLQHYVGQSFVCEVLEANLSQNRIVLSRRKVIEQERKRSRDTSMSSLGVGQVVSGRIEKIEPFGAFVEIAPGVTGLLHVSNISHQRLQHPEEVLKLGDKVEVQVLEISENGRRIGLGMKQLKAHPWESVAERWKTGTQVSGKVTRIAEFGAFIEVEPGIEGLLHASQLGSARHLRVADQVKVGESIPVRVLSVDIAQRRMSLTRLSERGSVIGSDEDVDIRTEAPDASIHRENDVPRATTNLGDVLRRALEPRPPPK